MFGEGAGVGAAGGTAGVELDGLPGGVAVDVAQLRGRAVEQALSRQCWRHGSCGLAGWCDQRRGADQCRGGGAGECLHGSPPVVSVRPNPCRPGPWCGCPISSATDPSRACWCGLDTGERWVLGFWGRSHLLLALEGCCAYTWKFAADETSRRRGTRSSSSGCGTGADKTLRECRSGARPVTSVLAVACLAWGPRAS